MRVASNTISETIIRQIQNISAQQTKLQTQIATGQRIFQPEDDPTAVSRVLNLESQQRQITQFIRNNDRALELSQASFANLRSVKQVSDRANEIATLGTGAIGAASAQAYAAEVEQMIEQALQLGNSRSRNDYLFAGAEVDAPPFAAVRDADGRVTSVTYEGGGAPASIALSATTSIAPGTPEATNLGIRDFINNLVALRDALEGGDPTTIAGTQDELIASEDLLVSALAENGGVQTRIESSRNNLFELADDLEKLVSTEADVDLPTTIVRLNQAQTSYQAALQSSANIMRLSLLDYIR